MTDAYEVVWPRSPQAVELQDLAYRPDSLDGCTVAFLWDYMFRGDEIFPVIAEELTARFPTVEIINFDQFGTTHGDGETELLTALPQLLRELGVDAVVSGMAC
ncbi:MAG: hypothetical protein ACI8XD_000745 [Thermoproteota archaeon]|jgi:hypothetical protein